MYFQHFIERWIVFKICSRSSAATPMLSCACRVPQSGQMSVLLSTLERDGTPP